MLGVYVERVTGSGVACGTVNLTTPKLREEKLELILKSPAMALSVRGLAAWLFMLFFQASYVNFQPVLSSSMSDISSNSLQTSIASPQHFMSQTTSISISILVHAPPPPSTSAPLNLCISLVNKRISWEQMTHCTPSSSLETTVESLPAGVYRLRSYLSTTGVEGKHWRGGHGRKEGYVEGSEDVVWFVVGERRCDG